MNTVTDFALSTSDHISLHGKPGPAFRPVGLWSADDPDAICDISSLDKGIRRLHAPVFLLRQDGAIRFSQSGQAVLGGKAADKSGLPLVGYLPPLQVRQLGDPGFCRDFNIRLPYMTGAMANGIASVELVKAVARAGLLGSFGAAGLGIAQIEEAIVELKSALGESAFCANLIFSPNEVGHEQAVVDLYLQHGVNLVEASAYMHLTPAVVHYRLAGIHQDQQGDIITPNRIIAKCSRIEVAMKWFSPPPDKFLHQLLREGKISAEQMALAGRVPMAQDVTVEADSGGHTDNRPAITLLPTIMALRDRLQNEYAIPLRVGMGGGIATPAAAAAAFAMGAAYIVTGTVNQACLESGSSDTVRQMLAEAQQADVVMAPAVDMFEMGVQLQVLKRGTLFAMRARKLYELYRHYDSIEHIPSAECASIEKTIFRAPMSAIWERTQRFFMERDLREIEKAKADPKHKMALMFRWYLGLSSRWANAGEPDRQADYQIWCGPAMGAFNEWTKGTSLAIPKNRKVVDVALNILFGAALLSRINQLRQQGLGFLAQTIPVLPLAIHEIETYIDA